MDAQYSWIINHGFFYSQKSPRYKMKGTNIWNYHTWQGGITNQTLEAKLHAISSKKKTRKKSLMCWPELSLFQIFCLKIMHVWPQENARDAVIQLRIGQMKFLSWVLTLPTSATWNSEQSVQRLSCNPFDFLQKISRRVSSNNISALTSFRQKIQCHGSFQKEKRYTFSILNYLSLTSLKIN
jgi:hypothetical protein